MESKELINVCLFIFTFVGGMGILYLIIYWVTCAINHKYGLDVQTEVKTIIKEVPQQPTIIRIESGMAYPQDTEIKETENLKKETNELFVEDNPMLKMKNVEDIKIETSFKKGKRIGKRK